MVWQEGKGPDVVIELLSEKTAAVDKGKKKLIYQNQLRVPEYFWYDPFSGELVGFRLHGGRYRPIKPDKQGRLISQQLRLALVRRQGWYMDTEALWLRWATLDGKVLPTQEEQADEAQRQTDEAQRRVTELETILAQYRQQFGDLPE